MLEHGKRIDSFPYIVKILSKEAIMKDGKMTKEDAYLLAFAFAIRDNCRHTSCLDCIFGYDYPNCRLKESVYDWNLEYQSRIK